MMKKLFSLCVALAFTLILAACSGGGAPAGAYDPDATAHCWTPAPFPRPWRRWTPI